MTACLQTEPLPPDPQAEIVRLQSALKAQATRTARAHGVIGRLLADIGEIDNRLFDQSHIASGLAAYVVDDDGRVLTAKVRD